MLPNYGKAHSDQLTRIHAEVAKQKKVVRVPRFVCGVATSPGLMQAGGIHPNEKTQARMLEAVWLQLRPKLRCAAKKPLER